jgi:KRAB domain-containing zinc finger protein
LSNREQAACIAVASSVDTSTSSQAVLIKQEPQDDTEKGDPSDELGEPRNPVMTQPSPPRNDTLPHADLEPLSVNLGKVKREKLDTTDTECSKCKIKFQDKGQLQKHVCSLSQWSCEHCNKYFKSKDTLYKHKKYFCPKKRNSSVCKGCGKVFSSLIELAQHQKVHLRVCMSLQEENLFTCTVCRKKFAARSMLEMHKKSHSSANFYMTQTEVSVQPRTSPGKILVKKFKCQYCPNHYTRRDKLKIHIKSHFVGEKSNSMPECSVESKQTNTSDSVPQSSKKCICKYCEYVCDDSAALWLHMLQQHSSEKAYKCNKCSRSFNHLHAYSNHKKTHNAKICCRVCGKPYSSSKALREHEYNKHSIQKAPHHCRLCTESFVTRSALLIHGRIHHTKGKNDAPLLDEAEVKVRTFPCSLCSKWFPSPVTLVAHMQTHIDMEMEDRDVRNENKGNLDEGFVAQSNCKKEEEHYLPLTCKICFKLFSNKACLQRHVKIHAGGKHVFYPCIVCGKKFISESTYKTHAATHMVSKSFHCHHCNKIFFKEEVFKCHTCENSETQMCLTCGVLLTEEQHPNHVCDKSSSKSSESLVRCNVCPAVFNSTKARNNHMRIHGRQVMLTAPLPPNLKSMCVKMSNGLYKCNLCGKLTTTQQGAAGHSRWHTYPQPVKQYHCPFCNRKYTTETGLYTHITAEHPEMPG